MVVDFAETADWDIKDNRISDEFLETVAGNLKAVPFSDRDICEGNVRGRTIKGFDFIFIVGRVDDKVVVTVGGVRRHRDEEALRKALKLAERFATLRGATGL
ncbi:MAG: hypothetical protein AAGI92_07975 [Pseudomonadota bacterium]